MSRKLAKLRQEAGDVIRALLAEVRAHADDYHHRTDERVLWRAEELLERWKQRSPDRGRPEDGRG
jgi:hypothetical protein